MSAQLQILSIDDAEDARTSSIQRQWNDMVAASPYSGLMQTTHWASFKRLQGFRSTHLIVSDGDRIVAGALGYAAQEGGRDGWLLMPDGPVLPWDDAQLARQCLQLIVERSRQMATEMNVIGMRVEPRLRGSVPSCMRAFRRAPFDLLPDQTICLDLRQSEEQLLSSMHSKCRYNIRLATKYGVRVREDLSASALRSFYGIMMDAAGRDDFFVEPLAFFQDLCLSTPPEMARLFLAEHDDDALAAILMVVCGGRATYLYGGTSNLKRNMMAGYAVQWHAIQAARAAGCSTYDFYGFVPPGNADHPYARFSRFKQQFGGQPERFIGAMDLAFTERLTDAVIRALLELHGERQARGAYAANRGGTYDQ